MSDTEDRRAGDLLDLGIRRTPDGAAAAAAALVAQDLRAHPPDGEVLARLGHRFGLSPFERDLLLLTGLPEEAAPATEIVRRSNPRAAPWMTAGIVDAWLQLDHRGRAWLRRALSVGPLVRFGLVRAMDDVPGPERSLRLTPGLWDLLRGLRDWPAQLDVDRVDRRTQLVGPAPSIVAALSTTTSWSEAMVVLVTGPASRGVDELTSVACASLAAAGRDWVVVGAAESSLDPAAVSVHAVARDVVPIVRGRVDGVPFPDHPGPIVVCTDEAVPFIGDARPVLSVAVPNRTMRETVSMWQALAPELNGHSERLAGVLRVDGLRATESVADARAVARLEGRPLRAGDVVASARRRSDRTLPPSVRRVVPDAHWDDLVTTPRNRAQLDSIVHRMREQVRVLGDWGFGSARVLAGSRVLLTGPPGTGKTLSVEIIAAALGIELLAVDLSALVSKWLGETEKNLGAVFDAAERSQAVLFFDEADAIFGKRTDAGDAQARWANLETAYLLSRIDRFDGVVALATNLRGNIDDAFVRRLDVIVEFEAPDEEQRAALWRLHLPPSAPIADDVDPDVLAKLYPVTGAVIRNAALGAAFSAAAASTSIDQHGLLGALEQEYRKAGRSFPGMPAAAGSQMKRGRS